MGLQAFNDSGAGIALATVLHTAGAIAFLGGVVAYLLWARHLRAGRDEPRHLMAATATTLVAVVANLLGGFLRTYESDHPGISQFAASAWVRVLVVKHVFLFAAMAAALVLLFPVASRLRAALRAGRPTRASGLEKAMVFVTLLGIAVAALLGAVSSVTPLPGAATPDDEAMPDHDMPPASLVPATRYHNATGTMPVLPTQPAPGGSFGVTADAASIEATLSWTPDAPCLRLELQGPAGEGTAASPAATPPCVGTAALEVTLPAPGEWSYRILSDLPAAGVAWQLTLRMPSIGDANETVVADTVTIRPGGGFHEVNTEMPGNATLRWDWTADGVVHFNVHSHFDGEVQDYVDEDADAHTGALTVDRAGGYSYLWANDGAVPVTVTYRVWGPFTVDSVVDV